MRKQRRVAKKAKNRQRYIGVDLHSNSFTACIFMEGAEPETLTLQLQGGGLEQFIKKLHPGDELAVEATSNSTWFRDQVIAHVARVVVIAPTHFDVIRRSVKKTDKNDAKAIALFLSKGNGGFSGFWLVKYIIPKNSGFRAGFTFLIPG